MPYSVFGLPLHPLVVHGTVVFVPLAAVFVLGAAFSPAFRRWAGPLPLLLSLVALVLVPISTASGENLEREVGHSNLVEEHAALADGLLPWVLGLVIVGGVLAWFWWRERTQEEPAPPARALAIGVAILALIAAAGTTQQVIRIGHSGAKAAWSDVTQGQTPPPSPGS